MPPEIMPDTSWWSDRGLAVVLVGITLSVAIWCLREAWKVWGPHIVERNAIERDALKRKRQAEIEKELKQAKLFDTLSEVEPQKVQTLQVLQESVAQIHENQQHHAAACDATHHAIVRVHETVETIAMRLDARTAEQVRRNEEEGIKKAAAALGH